MLLLYRQFRNVFETDVGPLSVKGKNARQLQNSHCHLDRRKSYSVRFFLFEKATYLF